jgi:hypothetical protein
MAAASAAAPAPATKNIRAGTPAAKIDGRIRREREEE